MVETEAGLTVPANSSPEPGALAVPEPSPQSNDLLPEVTDDSAPRAPRPAASGAAPSSIPPSAARVRRRLARLGAQRGPTMNPVLEPLIKTVRNTHPKADVKLIERAYDVAAHYHRDQKRKSGDPYITHPL